MEEVERDVQYVFCLVNAPFRNELVKLLSTFHCGDSCTGLSSNMYQNLLSFSQTCCLCLCSDDSILIIKLKFAPIYANSTSLRFPMYIPYHRTQFSVMLLHSGTFGPNVRSGSYIREWCYRRLCSDSSMFILKKLKFALAYDSSTALRFSVYIPYHRTQCSVMLFHSGTFGPNIRCGS